MLGGCERTHRGAAARVRSEMRLTTLNLFFFGSRNVESSASSFSPIVNLLASPSPTGGSSALLVSSSSSLSMSLTHCRSLPAGHVTSIPGTPRGTSGPFERLFWPPRPLKCCRFPMMMAVCRRCVSLPPHPALSEGKSVKAVLKEGCVETEGRGSPSWGRGFVFDQPSLCMRSAVVA